jgi:hypothetical protein
VERAAGTSIGATALTSFAPTAREAIADPRAVQGAATTSVHRLAAETDGGPEIEATGPAIGKHLVDRMAALNQGAGPDAGLHYAGPYQARYPDRWNPDWADGHADPTYWKRHACMQWSLVPGKSASAAIKAWLRGLTIAECTITIVALELDALRAAVGDDNFDAQFGREGDRERPHPFYLAPTGDHHAMMARLQQGPEGKVDWFLARTERAGGGDPGPKGRRNVQLGEWWRFANHPDYGRRHPAGAWGGENVLFVGEEAGVQYWQGFGIPRMTEDEIAEEFARAYGLPPTPADVHHDNYDETAPSELTAAEIEPHMLGGSDLETRGLVLDLAKVQALRGGTLIGPTDAPPPRTPEEERRILEKFKGVLDGG